MYGYNESAGMCTSTYLVTNFLILIIPLYPSEQVFEKLKNAGYTNLTRQYFKVRSVATCSLYIVLDLMSAPSRWLPMKTSVGTLSRQKY